LELFFCFRLIPNTRARGAINKSTFSVPDAPEDPPGAKAQSPPVEDAPPPFFPDLGTITADTTAGIVALAITLAGCGVKVGV